MSIIIVICIATFTLHAQISNLKWSGIITNGNSNDFYGMITDHDGNIYLTGRLLATTDMDWGPNVQNLPNGNFIAKYDSSGNYQWGIPMGVDLRRPVFDVNGNVMIFGAVTGGWGGTMNFNLTGTAYLVPFASDVCYVARYSPAGTFIDVPIVIEDLLRVDIGGLSVDSSGNLYISGVYEGAGVDLDAGPGNTNLPFGGGIIDGFLAKYTSSGQYLWSTTLSGNNDDYVSAIQADKAGSIVISGAINSDSIDIDPGPVEQYLYHDPTSFDYGSFVVKYTPTNTLDWAFQLGGINGGSCGIVTLAVDDSGSIIIPSNVIGSVDFDPGVAVQTGNSFNQDIFLAKYDSNGNLIWFRNLEGLSTDEYVNDMVVDHAGDIIMSGIFQSPDIDFDPLSGQAYLNNIFGSFDKFVAKFGNQTGNLIWAFSSGTGANDYAYALTTDRSNNILCASILDASTITYPLDIDPGNAYVPVYASGLGDILIIKYSPDYCFPVALDFDSLQIVTCTNLQGRIHTTVIAGRAPFTYLWNTNAQDTFPDLYPANANLYQVKVTGIDGCYESKGIFLDGPNPSAFFDLGTGLVTGPFIANRISNINIYNYNTTCTPTPGVLTLVIDPLTDFQFSTPVPDIVSGDTLRWNLDPLDFDSSFSINVIVKTKIFAIIGDTVNLLLKLTPINGDIDISNNVRSYHFPVRSSYDPNDKQVFPQGKTSQGNISNNQKMTYTIRFQNTGNFVAFNIAILDTISSYLDLSSFKIIASSDSVVAEIFPDRAVKFNFENINLPDSGFDEPGSHGYVVYEIYQYPNLAINTVLPNKAFIYFDFNPAIETNEVINTIYLTVTSIPAEHGNSELIVFPNPFNEEISITSNNANNNYKITLTDLSGRIILYSSLHNKYSSLYLSTLQSGIYLLNILDESDAIIASKKLVKR